MLIQMVYLNAIVAGVQSAGCQAKDRKMRFYCSC